MFIRTLDQRSPTKALTAGQSARVVPPMRKFYPLRIMARFFAVAGLAAVVYAVVLVGLFFHGGIIAF